MGIIDFDVENTVYMQRDIVLSDCNLRRYFNNLLSQVVNIGDLVDEGNNKVHTWLQLTLELGEAVNHCRVLFTNDHYEPVV